MVGCSPLTCFFVFSSQHSLRFASLSVSRAIEYNIISNPALQELQKVWFVRQFPPGLESITVGHSAPATESGVVVGVVGIESIIGSAEIRSALGNGACSGDIRVGLDVEVLHGQCGGYVDVFAHIAGAVQAELACVNNGYNSSRCKYMQCQLHLQNERMVSRRSRHSGKSRSCSLEDKRDTPFCEPIRLASDTRTQY